MSPPREVTVSYVCHPYDAVLACYPRVHAKNFRVPQSDDVLKQHAIARSTIRLHKLFRRAQSLSAMASTYPTMSRAQIRSVLNTSLQKR